MTRKNKRLKKDKKLKNSSFFTSLGNVLRHVKLFFIGFLVLGLLGVSGFYGSQIVNGFLDRPITEVVVKGSFTYLSEVDIEQMMELEIEGSFIGENLNRIRQRLEKNEWVHSFNLHRQWPGRLVVTIREQDPIARWGEKGFVNTNGELIVANNLEQMQSLPELDGDIEKLFEIIQQYHLLAKYFQQYDVGIAKLAKDQRDAWQVTLNTGWLVILGRGDTLEKVQRLTHLLDRGLLNDAQAVSMIDIRYANGISVKWSSLDGIEVGKAKGVAISSAIQKSEVQLNSKKYNMRERG